MRRFDPRSGPANISIGFNHVALPKIYRAHIVFSGSFLATGAAPAFAADPTGDWRVADGVANIRVAQCNGNMWGVVSWEKTPGGRDKNNPDAAKQSRPTLGMPILIDMKKKPGIDAWEGQVYNAKDGQLYSSTIKPSAPTSSKSRAACWASCAAAKPGPASGRRFPQAPPTAWPRARRRTGSAAPKAGTAAPRRLPPGLARRRPPARDPAPAQKPAPVRQRPRSRRSVGDICLLPDIARFAH